MFYLNLKAYNIRYIEWIRVVFKQLKFYETNKHINNSPFDAKYTKVTFDFEEYSIVVYNIW